MEIKNVYEEKLSKEGGNKKNLAAIKISLRPCNKIRLNVNVCEKYAMPTSALAIVTKQ